MSEWWTYTPSDFLMFSPRVYYRLFELYNRTFWPLAIISLAAGIAILVLLLRPIRVADRIIPAVLGVLWIWIAWAFFAERYASINWASVYVALFFAAQGAALVWVGAARGGMSFAAGRHAADVVALALYGLSVIGYPLLAALMGRSWLAAEIFGLAPDPTALATLALLALARGGRRWPLLIVPSLWCLISGLTLWVMEAGDFFIAPLGTLVALAVARVRVRA
jgi:hypothetical protein